MSTDANHRISGLLSAIILGISFIAGSFILGQKWKESRAVNFVTVKGLSEREVEADRAWWSIQSVYGSNSVDEIQLKINDHEKKVKSFLLSAGFNESEIRVENLNVYQNQYRDASQLYNADIRISVLSDDVGRIDKASSNLGSLISMGVLVTGDKWSNGPKYYYTKFKEVKTEMLSEATQEAKKAASEFAVNSGSRVGKIRKANQGIFLILPANRTNESEEFYRNKIIRVVSTVDYYLN